jgi:hypothetical protein
MTRPSGFVQVAFPITCTGLYNEIAAERAWAEPTALYKQNLA